MNQMGFSAKSLLVDIVDSLTQHDKESAHDVSCVAQASSECKLLREGQATAAASAADQAY